LYLLTTTSKFVPGLVLVHGSGPQSGDSVQIGQLGAQFPSPIPVFTEIGAALAAQGIAVLTYDKRSCGSFNACYDNDYPFPSAELVIDDSISDAMAAVKYLQHRPKVDSEKVVVSQAGSFVPIILEAMLSIASGIMLAGSYRAINELLVYQLEFTFQLLETSAGLNRM
jgi:hypothetical protein